jgi:hypothetical protein
MKAATSRGWRCRRRHCPSRTSVQPTTSPALIAHHVAAVPPRTNCSCRLWVLGSGHRCRNSRLCAMSIPRSAPGVHVSAWCARQCLVYTSVPGVHVSAWCTPCMQHQCLRTLRLLCVFSTKMPIHPPPIRTRNNAQYSLSLPLPQYSPPSRYMPRSSRLKSYRRVVGGEVTLRRLSEILQ